MVVTSRTSPARVGAGVRTGGQFATEARGEVDIALTRVTDVEQGEEGEEEVADEEIRPVYSLLTSVVEEAKQRIEKANRRLARAGIDERFTYELTEPYVTAAGDPPVEKFYRDLTLSHPSISYEGWEFVAAVDHTPGGAIVRSKPGVELNGWRPEVSECDHCGTTRRRSATYLVRHQDGTCNQVGSSCMADFLGVKPAGLWALGFDPLADDEEDSWRSGAGESDRATPSIDVLAVALAVTDGGRHYQSRDAAMRSGGACTADAVRTQLFGAHARETAKERAERERLAEEAQRYLTDGTADAVLTYARTMEGSQDYAQNMRTLAGGEYVGAKHTALLASAVSGWARDNDRQAVRAARASAYVPGHLAGVGEKVAGNTAVVEKVVYVDNYYSPDETPDTLLIMRASTGHTLKWKASGYHDLNAGDTLSLTGGRVKEHSAYQDQDQTVLTRVKYEVQPPPGAGEGEEHGNR